MRETDESHRRNAKMMKMRQQWTSVPGSAFMPTMANPYWWDRFKLATHNPRDRWCDSMLGEKNTTIIQLEKNVIDDNRMWPIYVYPRMYAREEHVVDWSGIEQHDKAEYFYGLILRYGHPDEWEESDEYELDEKWPLASGDRNVYRIGPPPGFRRPKGYQSKPPQTHYIEASFGAAFAFNPYAKSSLVTHELPPIGCITMWQEKEDIDARRKAANLPPSASLYSAYVREMLDKNRRMMNASTAALDDDDDDVSIDSIDARIKADKKREKMMRKKMISLFPDHDDDDKKNSPARKKVCLTQAAASDEEEKENRTPNKPHWEI